LLLLLLIVMTEMFMISLQKVQFTEDVAVHIAADFIGGGKVLGAPETAEAAAVEKRVADLADFFRRCERKLTTDTPANTKSNIYEIMN
jgi:hypothetical protein